MPREQKRSRKRKKRKKDVRKKIDKKKEKDKQYRRDKRQEIAASKKESVNGSDSGFAKPSIPGNSSKKEVAPPPGFPGKKVVAPPPGFPGAKTVAPPPGFKGKETVAPPPGYPAGEESRKRSIPPPPGFKGEPDAKKFKKDDDNEPGEQTSEEEAKRKRTVFLSNLDFEVDDDEIKNIMSSSGNVIEVRLVKNPTGKSKGYAFVEFESQNEAKLALERDNELIGKRPMYVSECNPDKNKDGEGSSFKYGTGLEKNKLFIKGLDLNVTRPELAELFGKYGKVAAVRLVTYRNGHSKGIAFVDFEDEVSAATALVKTDGMSIKGKEIQVALSNPPKRKDPVPSDMKSLGGTTQTDFGPRGKARSQVAFTPRSVTNASTSVRASDKMKLEPMKFVKAAGSTDGIEGKKGETDDIPKPEVQTKSNSDFRKMFLQ